MELSEAVRLLVVTTVERRAGLESRTESYSTGLDEAAKSLSLLVSAIAKREADKAAQS